MKTRLSAVVAACLLAVAALPTLAQNQPLAQHASGQHASAPHERGGPRADVALAKLELALKLQDNQQAAWKAFADQVRAGGEARRAQMEKMHEAMRAAHESKTPPNASAQLDMRAQALQAELTQVNQTKAATDALLKTLSPAQQTVFNAEVRALMRPQGGRHGGPQGHMERSGMRGEPGQGGMDGHKGGRHGEHKRQGPGA